MSKKPEDYWLENKILLAMPGQADRAFQQSVVFIASYHVKEGAKGFIVNRPNARLNLTDLFIELNMPLPEAFRDIPVYDGGPDSRESGYILHSSEQGLTSSVQINDDVSLSVTQDILQNISTDNAPKNFQIVFGHCVWDVGQLENEIKNNLWFVCDFDARFLFQRTPPETQWQQAFQTLGIDTRFLSPQTAEV